MRLLVQPYGPITLGEFLKRIFKGEFGNFDAFQASIAFAKKSGVRHIQNEITDFLEKGNQVRIVVGVDHSGTTQEGLEALLQCCNPIGEVWINHCEDKYITYHPKVYLFESSEKAIAIMGSQNLTEGGLYTNDEASAIHWMDLKDEKDIELLQELKSYFDIWCNPKSKNSKILDVGFLTSLIKNGHVLPEAISFNEGQPPKKATTTVGDKENLFSKSEVKRLAPTIKVTKSAKTPTEIESKTSVSELLTSSSIGFVMTLQKTDVGTGQTTIGTSRRSPEIFIPLSARDYSPEFWGWKDQFIEDSKRQGKFDRLGVKMRVGVETATVNMMTWPVKHDFRLRSEVLRSAGNIGDLLRIEKVENSKEFSYYVEIIPVGTTSYDQYLELCSNTTRNSKKTWGYYS